ncbi:MAG: PAS domain S-box protein [Acidobacteria bacterium]|nr:PAS domain S-box protein [Acidobacteriota bacterium]
MPVATTRAVVRPLTAVVRLLARPAAARVALGVALGINVLLLASAMGLWRRDLASPPVPTGLALAGVIAVVAALLLVWFHRRLSWAAGWRGAQPGTRPGRDDAFLAVAEAARVAIVTTDAEGRFTYLNAAAEQMLGVSRAHVKGVSCAQYVSPSEQQRFLEGLGKFLAGQGRLAAGVPVPLVGRRHNGEEFQAEVLLSWYESPRGRYVAGVIVDLSERLRAEAAARAVEERWKAAVEGSDDGIWDWDVTADTLHGSRRLFAMLGHDQITAVRSAEWDAFVHEEDRGRFRDDIKAHLAGESEQYVSEYRVRCSDGSYRWVLARGRVVARDAQGVATRVVGTVSDVTERRAAVETLQLAREHAERAARSKSDFLAVMSHELRTPLNGVLGMATLLGDTPLTGEQRDYLDLITRSGQSLLHLIDDVLDFSKIEAGRVVLEQIPTDVGGLAREVAAMLRVPAAEKGLSFDIDVSAGTPSPVITDPGRVRQVLFNLVGNAVKFTETGSVCVAVSCDGVDAGRATLRLTVTDTGIGIPEDKQPLLFEKFMQADASTTRRFGGTGLGLAISKGLVDGLGGTIGVTSAVGEGSCFWFTIVAPIAVAPAASRDVSWSLASLAMPAPAGRPDVAAVEPSRRVLVAEDNPVNQRVAVAMLEKLGYAADVAGDGHEAVRMARATRYAVILMDCHMPGLDGYEATRQLERLLPAGNRPPVVAMTAAGIEGARERCLSAGMADYLLKPVELPKLRAMLERWVEQPALR